MLKHTSHTLRKRLKTDAENCFCRITLVFLLVCLCLCVCVCVRINHHTSLSWHCSGAIRRASQPLLLDEQTMWLSAGRGALPARLGLTTLQHIYINITSFHISLAERTHQHKGKSGGGMDGWVNEWMTGEQGRLKEKEDAKVIVCWGNIDGHIKKLREFTDALLVYYRFITPTFVFGLQGPICLVNLCPFLLVLCSIDSSAAFSSFFFLFSLFI